MSGEIIAILGVGIALAGVILTATRGLRQDMTRLETRLDGRIGGLEERLREDMKQGESRLEERINRLESRLRDDIKQLGDRMARVEHSQAKLEGLLEGLREAITGRVRAS